MSLTAEKMRDKLSAQMDVTVCGAQEQIIYAARRVGQEAFQCHTIYFAPEDYPLPAEPDVCLFLVAEENIASAVEIANELIVEDYRRTVELSKLQQAVQQQANDDTIVTFCRTIMGNPVWIADSHLNPIAFSISEDKAVIAGYTPLRNYVGQLSAGVELINPDSSYPSQRIVGNIVNREGHSLGFVVALDIEKPFDPPQDLEFAAHICDILSGWQRLRDVLIVQNANSKFVDNLLQLRITDPLMINQQMRALKWQTFEKYYVLVIERTPTEQLAPIRTEIETVLNKEIYLFGRYYISIFGCSLKEKLDSSHFKNLIRLLKKYQIRSALSNGFVEFSEFSNAFFQAIECLKFRGRMADSICVFSRYEDHLMTHFMRIASNQGINLLAMCDPVMVSLLQQDLERGTENFKTIAAYIFHSLNLKDTAASLYIHRNTAYRRLLALSEQYQFRFDDPAELEKMKLSIMILGYLGMVDWDTYVLLYPEDVVENSSEP